MQPDTHTITPFRKTANQLLIFFSIASLLFKDDYSGGEWLLHLHRGYPYSWRDGGISVWPAIENGFTVSEYVAHNPTLVQWTVDLRALVIDSVFWLNAGILIILFGFGSIQD